VATSSVVASGRSRWALLPGLALTLGVAAIAHLSSTLHHAFDPLVISLIFGMLVANVIEDKAPWTPGVEAALRLALPLGIILYGAQITVQALPWWVWGATGATFAFTFGVAYFIARGFGLERHVSLLLGTGLSVCGASAIAVIAPVIGARKQETSISIIAVVTVGLTGMLILRFLPGVLGLSPVKLSFLAGAVLPMLGQVKVAASAMGPGAVEAAVSVKLIRVAALALVASLLLVFGPKGRETEGFPWYLLLFFAFAIVTNVLPAAGALRAPLGVLSTFFLAVALSAIGLSLEFDAITEYGTAPLFSAGLAWGIVILGLYIILSIVG
jgi:uncharacterized integral membrane protein (TIGR00698 family)